MREIVPAPIATFVQSISTSPCEEERGKVNGRGLGGESARGEASLLCSSFCFFFMSGLICLYSETAAGVIADVVYCWWIFVIAKCNRITLF